MNNQLVAWLTALSAMDKGVIAVWGLMLLAYGINRQHPKWFRGSGLLLVIVTILSLVYFWKTYFVVGCWGLNSGPRVWKCGARDSIKLLRFYSAVL